MSPAVIVYVLTALAALVIVLTRVRLSSEGEGAGNFSVGRGALNVHTIAGALALIFWVVFLVTDDDTFSSESTRSLIGIVGLAFWWLTAIAGMLILLRWLPAHGRHASARSDDTWSEGPGLSLLAHIGLAVGVLVFTGFYLFGNI